MNDEQEQPEADSLSEERVFDITADSIAPAVDRPVKTFTPKIPAAPIAPAPAAPTAAPQAQSVPIRPTTINPVGNLDPNPEPVIPPIVLPPLQTPPIAPRPVTTPVSPAEPRQPINIPLSDFTNSLQKASAIQAKPPAPASPEDFFPKAADLKALRTYETDVAEVLAHTKASTTSIALAEAKKESGQDKIGNEEVEEPSHAGRKALLIVLSLILVIVGLGGAYYLYSQSALAPSAPQQQAAQPAPSLIPADKQDVLAIDGLSPPAALSHIAVEVNKPWPANSITEIIPIETSATGQKARVTEPEMQSLMEVNPPDILTRSLDQPWMLGVYTDESGNHDAFVVVATNFFQNAFAGMLQWESVMADDLKQYLGTANVSDIANVGASSTEPLSAYALNGHFEDRIIMNKDVRAFVTTDGQTLFLYSFVDNSKLVVAKNEATLREILTRLENQAFIR